MHQGDGNRPAASRWRALGRSLAAPALLFLVITLFYWKLTLSNQYSWMDSPDFAYQVLPWFQFQAGEWHSNGPALWDPYVWGGQPLIGQAQPGTAYPPNWLLFLVPLRHGWMRMAALHWYYVLIHWAAAFFCYLLCRDLGRSRGASLLAGLGFSVAGWFGNTDWPQMINGALWTPLVFLFLLRTLRGVRPLPSAALAGTFLGIAFLSGHHQVPVYVTLACGGLWLYGLLRSGRLERRLIAPAGAFGLFFLLTGALQTLPAWEYGRLAVRWVGGSHPVGWNEPVPYFVHAQYGLGPLSLVGIVIPGFSRHADPYIGFVLAGFAFLALAVMWREWHVRVLAAVGLGGLVFSLAQHGWFEGLLYALVPVVEKARNPSMAIFMFHFSIVVLFAYGIDAYMRNETWSRRLRMGLAVAGGTIFLCLFATSLAVSAPPKDNDMIALAGFSALLLAGLLFGWSRGHLSGRVAVVLLGLLLVMEAGSRDNWTNRGESRSLLKNLPQLADVADFLRSRGEPVRVDMDFDDVPYNFGDLYGVDVFGGYLASLTTNIDRMQSDPRARLLMATNYSVGKAARYEQQQQVYTSASGLKVYRNLQAFPRAWSVHEAVSEPSPDAIHREIDSQPLGILRRRAYLEGKAPALATCSTPDRVRFVSRTANSAVVEAVMGCRGMVIAAEPYFPGWRATVDGRPAQVFETYNLLRGVVVEGGIHQVVFTYRPASVILGGILTGCGLFGALVIGVMERRRSIGPQKKVRTPTC